jgi:hypothetical protein
LIAFEKLTRTYFFQIVLETILLVNNLSVQIIGCMVLAFAMHVLILANSPSYFTAVGEPPQCMSCSCLFAVQDAIYHALEEIGKDKDYFALDGPATVEATQLKCLVDPSQFVF